MNFSELHGACSSEAVEEQIPLQRVNIPAPDVVSHVSLNQTHGWNNSLYWSILRLTLLLYFTLRNLDTLVIAGLPIHTWITWETAQQCLGNVFLLVIFLFSLVILHQLQLPSLFSFTELVFLCIFFQVSLSLFLPIQNIFPCLQSRTLPHYFSIPLSVSSFCPKHHNLQF